MTSFRPLVLHRRGRASIMPPSVSRKASISLQRLHGVVVTVAQEHAGLGRAMSGVLSRWSTPMASRVGQIARRSVSTMWRVCWALLSDRGAAFSVSVSSSLHAVADRLEHGEVAIHDRVDKQIREVVGARRRGPGRGRDGSPPGRSKTSPPGRSCYGDDPVAPEKDAHLLVVDIEPSGVRTAQHAQDHEEMVGIALDLRPLRGR